MRFSVRTPDIDERPLPGELPGPHVRRLALAKARAVARALAPGHRAQWVIGADTVVVLDGAILGKPRGKYEPVQMMIVRDFYEILEKAIDRCREAGVVIYQIVLKNG